MCLVCGPCSQPPTHPERGPVNSVQGGVPEPGRAMAEKQRKRSMTVGPADSHQRHKRTTFIFDSFL